MKIERHPAGGTEVILDGNEFATAIHAYIAAHNVHYSGPRTVRAVIGGAAVIARDVTVSVYVDPSGRVVDNREFSDPDDQAALRGLWLDNEAARLRAEGSGCTQLAEAFAARGDTLARIYREVTGRDITPGAL